MKIVGADGLSADQIRFEVDRGAKFVLFGYCFSVLMMTFRRSSPISFIRPGESVLTKSESVLTKSAGWTVLAALVGWWGFPWGLIYMPMTLYQNLRSGRDVTGQIVASLDQRLVIHKETERRYYEHSR